MAWDLKNEEEVKEFSDKVGHDYRFGCLNEKKPEGEIGIRYHYRNYHTLINCMFHCCSMSSSRGFHGNCQKGL
jgi:hypothetical protein